MIWPLEGGAEHLLVLVAGPSVRGQRMLRRTGAHVPALTNTNTVNMEHDRGRDSVENIDLLEINGGKAFNKYAETSVCSNYPGRM